MRYVDAQKREDEILDILVDSYIKEYHPISSFYLCESCHLPYSSATVRNVMESLEKKSFLSHVHTSSGRVPTSLGFRHYVEHLNCKDSFSEDEAKELKEVDALNDIGEILDRSVDILSNISGYTSLMGIWGLQDKFYFRGIRFILQQPEFEDIEKVRQIFYALEVKIEQIQDLLFYYIDGGLSILIGDEIGFDEISECSLLVSGIQEKGFALALAILGPMRMNYVKAANSLYAIKHKLESTIKRLK